ncbi:MAG: DUF354 domain-containing protein [Solirubrobacterales bacterium]
MRVWIDVANSPQPVLFGPIAERFAERGDEVVVSYRDHAQTEELTLERWPEATRIGDPSPPGYRKAFSIAARVRLLRRFARAERPDVALSHNSFAQIIATRSLGIPTVTAMDYEHHPANHFAFRGAHRILLPEAVPADVVRRQGAVTRKVQRYEGLKEEVYLGRFEADPDILAKLGIERPPGGLVVIARSAAAGALYHPGENRIFHDCLTALDRRGDVATVAIARFPDQREALRALGLASVTVPERAIDAQSLMHASDAFIGAGGTMSREAALLGLDTWSAFAGNRPSVDRWLEDRGRLRTLTDPAQLADLAPRRDAAADLEGLAERGERIIEAFVAATTETAER